MSGDVVARRVVVSGRVQGVWYRQSCAEAAGMHDVGGWVRNLGDGRVEAWLEGEAPAVERVVAWCRIGPPRAHVSAVDVEPCQPAGYASFEVRG